VRKIKLLVRHSSDTTWLVRRLFENKSVFSFLRQLQTWHCPHLLLRAAAAPAVQQSIDISYPPDPQQQTRRMSE